jgi:nucleotide-binding universal stress UspA family protein
MALATPGTEIVLLTVIPVADALSGPGGDVLVPADEASAAQGDEARTRLEIVAEGLRAAGHAVLSEVVVGDPADRIVQTAAALDAFMIVMASHGRGAVGRLLRGSVADRVGREATVPVLVVRAGETTPGPVGITRLVVPLDGSPLAEGALAVATAISKRLGAPLFLVRAVNPVELMPPAVGFGEVIPAEIYDETQEELEKSARDYLEATAGRLRDEGYPVATHVLVGPPGGAIIAATHLGDVVVLVSHERSGVMRWLLGSVAEQLVREDDSPVILVPAPETAKDQ